MRVNVQELINKTGSAYKLVIMASLRAIELGEGAAKLVDAPLEEKPLNIALQEISEGKVSYKKREKIEKK